jgi:hypothetical protein
MRTLRYFALIACLFLLTELRAQSPSKITQEERELLTYPYSDPNPVAIHLKTSKIYPYMLFEGYSKTGKKQKWKVVKLENDYIEVYVLPEAGGKIWGAIEKSTGKEFIYRNEVIKFRNIAMRGPWTSGGIEFNFGIIGHHPSTSSPVDYKVVTNVDGSVSCIVGNLDLPSRTNWSVEIRLPKDKAYIETNASWNNPTPIHQAYYNWMTAAAVVSDDLEFYYPGNIALEHDGSPTPWPIDKEGRDISKYKNNNYGTHKSIHTVGEYNDYMAGYYRQSKFGFGHWALYDDMPGHKLWLWALSRNGGIWEDLLTDSDGQYMEFQAGRQLNQYSPSSVLKSSITQVPFAPGTTDRWTERWFPIKDTGGVTDVSPYGVLNVDGKDISVNSLAFAAATIEVRSRGKIVHSEKKSFKPMDVFHASIEGDEITIKEMDLHYTLVPDSALKRSFIADPTPKEFTRDALYREGVQLKEAREYRKAMKIFRQCLQQDSLHFGALTDVAEMNYRSGLYDSALFNLSKVLRHDTYHPKANYLAGICYKAKGDLINSIESFGWAARSMEYRSTAYAQMAAVQIARNDFALAGHYAKQALDYNKYNVNALHALLIIKSQNVTEYDKLDHFAQYEKESEISVQNEFPHQAYLETALEYLSFGLKDKAIAVLLKAPQEPEVKIWTAYLKNDVTLLKQVSNESPAFVFPYRTESLAPLQWAVSQNDDWRFKYFLGLNYYALQRDKEAVDMLATCKDQPDYAPFYLTRSILVTDINDLLTANKIAPGEWRTWTYLIEYFEKNGIYDQQLTYAQQASQKFKDNYTLQFALAKALMNNGKYKESIQVLQKLDVLPFEGSGEGHEVYEQVLLLRAVELMEGKNYKEALKNIDLSKEWPERLGEGKPYDVDTRLQDYMTAYCLHNQPAITIEALREEFKGKRYKEIIERLSKLQPRG